MIFFFSTNDAINTLIYLSNFVPSLHSGIQSLDYTYYHFNPLLDSIS